MSVLILPSGAGRLVCFHNGVRKLETGGGDASHEEGDERNAIRKSSAARLCRWPEGAEEEYQERIPVFSVITRAAGNRTREFL